MKNILSNVPTNKENAKNDEEIAAPFSENLDSSSIKESQESATTAKVIKKESDTEESVAEKVEGSILLKSTLLRISSTTTKRMMTINT